MTEMQDVDHTHPHTQEAFGFRFQRGAVVADGGEDQRGEPDDETMADVTHDTEEDEATTRTFERGTEGRDGTV
ncbi:hypothetical protein [Salinirussus salinus]|jgi:hypothetical protein|uniref:hypothetical protein n=1 Tax=Salinirussus salinus TaxID=1198300 RepID=UPI001359A741|nr:hypothetical protein [Salinirussus salinus]